MPSWVVTGVSKGLGFEFLRQISANPENTVIGLVRDKPATEKRVVEELEGRKNIHILHGDLDNYATLKTAVADVARITGGSLDYIIANAGLVPRYDAFRTIGELGENPEELSEQFDKVVRTNVLGNIHLYNLFIPLILKGAGKKVVVISSGMGDMEMVNYLELGYAPLYGMSKTAMNMITAKFNAQYKKDGITFLSICPGMVDVGHGSNPTPEEMAVMGDIMGKFQRYSPTFKGPDVPEESIRAILAVIDKRSVEQGDGGAYLSHFGTKAWL